MPKKQGGKAQQHDNSVYTPEFLSLANEVKEQKPWRKVDESQSWYITCTGDLPFQLSPDAQKYSGGYMLISMMGASGKYIAIAAYLGDQEMFHNFRRLHDSSASQATYISLIMSMLQLHVELGGQPICSATRPGMTPRAPPTSVEVELATLALRSVRDIAPTLPTRDQSWRVLPRFEVGAKKLPEAVIGAFNAFTLSPLRPIPTSVIAIEPLEPRTAPPQELIARIRDKRASLSGSVRGAEIEFDKVVSMVPVKEGQSETANCMPFLALAAERRTGVVLHCAPILRGTSDDELAFVEKLRDSLITALAADGAPAVTEIYTRDKRLARFLEKGLDSTMVRVVVSQDLEVFDKFAKDILLKVDEQLGGRNIGHPQDESLFNIELSEFLPKTPAKFNMLKQYGNQWYEDGDLRTALRSYLGCIESVRKGLCKGVSNEDLGAVHSNASAAFLKLEQYEEALEHANSCIESRPNWFKAYYRRGNCLRAQGDKVGACEAYRRALGLDPENKELKQLVDELTA